MLAGDFNIIRYPYAQHYLAKVFGISPGCAQHLELLESEYSDLLETLSRSGTYEVFDCWDRDNKDPNLRCITCGESREESNGERVSLETCLTAYND